MRTGTPRLSVGLPVYNGEAFLERAIDTLLAQTYRDFELIIADNASTDGTEAICRSGAARDPRVRYFRNEENTGAMMNFRRVFELARGELFKWAAHDDEHEPEYLRRCIEALDADPGVVLAYTRARYIDQTGTTTEPVHSAGLDAGGASATDRFRALVRREYPCFPIFGVIRADVLRRTRLLANYADCDRVLLSELGLAGRMAELPEPLFVHREHRHRSVWQYKSRQTRGAWFDPHGRGRPAFPYARQFRGYATALRRAPLTTGERMRCAGILVEWTARNLDGLWEDVIFAARFAARPVKRRVMHAPRSTRPMGQ